MESLVRSTRTELIERSFSRPRSFIHIRLLVQQLAKRNFAIQLK